LRRWLKAQKKTTKQFSDETGYSYIHAYQLQRGAEAITDATVGRLLIVYGTDGPAPAIAEVLRTQREKNGNGGKT
jgi:hypothetical protein